MLRIPSLPARSKMMVDAEPMEPQSFETPPRSEAALRRARFRAQPPTRSTVEPTAAELSKQLDAVFELQRGMARVRRAHPSILPPEGERHAAKIVGTRLVAPRKSGNVHMLEVTPLGPA